VISGGEGDRPQENGPKAQSEGIGDLNGRVNKHPGRRSESAIVRRPPVKPVQSVDDFDTQFDAEPVHHRWLLTTCVAGIAGCLIVGGVVLGLFGENAAPRDAFAAIKTASIAGENPLTPPKKSLALDGTTVNGAGEMIVPERDLSNDNNYPEITADELPYGDGKTIVLDAEIQASEQETENITTITKTPPPEPVDQTFKLAKGETLVDALVDLGVTKESAQALVAAIEPIFPSRLLKADTEFEVTLDRQQDFYGHEVTFPVELSFKPGPKETIKVEADEDGQFAAAVDGAKEGTKSQYAVVNQLHTKVTVGSGLYATAQDNKIPDYIVAELTRAFSYDVDFQHQVKPSDTFEVFYGNPLSGSSSKRKVLHFAQLTLGGKTKTLYRYTTRDGQTDYYDDNGQSATKSLLKTPVSGARITSGFGMRVHPLLGYSKMHTGIDFGVPYGTPIRAAGSGTVMVAGRHGAYGNTVELSHNDKYETLYGHMSRLAAGIRRGVRVNQGQIIGYVGSTGRSTGPHLHYEIRVHDRPVNPGSVKVAGGRKLTGAELAQFKATKQRVLAMMQVAPSALQMAQTEP
jgi:murein DD-endopeptidase MepM/ murein hydrolase activator NlpD